MRLMKKDFSFPPIRFNISANSHRALSYLLRKWKKFPGSHMNIFQRFLPKSLWTNFYPIVDLKNRRHRPEKLKSRRPLGALRAQSMPCTKWGSDPWVPPILFEELKNRCLCDWAKWGSGFLTPKRRRELWTCCDFLPKGKVELRTRSDFPYHPPDGGQDFWRLVGKKRPFSMFWKDKSLLILRYRSTSAFIYQKMR